MAAKGMDRAYVRKVPKQVEQVDHALAVKRYKCDKCHYQQLGLRSNHTHPEDVRTANKSARRSAEYFGFVN